MSAYPNAPGHRGVDTSIAAANDLSPKLGPLQRRAECAIRAAGWLGLTADELATRLGLDRWSIQPRTSELKRKGLIRDSGQRRPNSTQAGNCLDRGMTGAAMVLHGHGGTFETSPVLGFGEVSTGQPRFNNGRRRAIANNGTHLAISILPLGVAALSAKRTGRGGARNLADRESHALTAAQIANLNAAEPHATAIGLPFTRMLTIHWEAAGVPLSGMAKASGRFTDLLRKALARHGSDTSWLWVHENGDRKGGHCHLLAHVPAALAPMVTGLQRGWLRRISGRPYRARVIHSKPIGGRLGLEKGNPDLLFTNSRAALAYVLKGAAPEAASLFGLERVEPGGRVIGKRCGTSQNIAAKARGERK